MTLVAILVVALVVAGCRAGYRWHDNRRIPPLDPYWTEGNTHER